MKGQSPRYVTIVTAVAALAVGLGAVSGEA